MNGYIKLYRQFTKWEWYDDANTMRLFLHFLLNANHEPNKWHGIEIKSGQLLTGRLKLARALKLSEREIRTALEHLKTTNEITVKSTSQYSIITINNWNLFQQSSQQNDQRPTNDRPTNDRPTTTNKNDENNKNDKKYTYGSRKNIKLTKEEYSRFIEEFGEENTNKVIEYLSAYKEEKGYKTKSDNLTIRRWVLDACGIKKIDTNYGGF